MRVRPSAILLVASLLTACSSPSPSPLEGYVRPRPLALTGRYTGTWNIDLMDSVIQCGVNSCSYPIVGWVRCGLTVDVTMPSDRTYAGQFTIDTTSRCGGGLDRSPSPHPQITSVAFRGVWDSTFFGEHVSLTVGNRSAADMEQLIGCTLNANAVPNWEFSAGGVYPDSFYEPGHPPRTERDAIGLRGSPEWDRTDYSRPGFPAVCEGRYGWIQIEFTATR